MSIETVKQNSLLASGFGLAVLGTTCCALPIVFVSLGFGSVVASVVSALPWLGWLSGYKAITFSVTALVLVYSWWRLAGIHRDLDADHCSISDGRRLHWQMRILIASSVIFVAAVFAAYALLPITRWLEQTGA